MTPMVAAARSAEVRARRIALLAEHQGDPQVLLDEPAMLGMRLGPMLRHLPGVGHTTATRIATLIGAALDDRIGDLGPGRLLRLRQILKATDWSGYGGSGEVAVRW